MELEVIPPPYNWGDVGLLQRILGRALSSAKPGDSKVLVVDGEDSDLSNFRGTRFIAIAIRTFAQK